MKRKQRRLQLQKAKTPKPPPFVRSAFDRRTSGFSTTYEEPVETFFDDLYAMQAEQIAHTPRAPWVGANPDMPDWEALLRDADELHRRQKPPCDVISRREAREIMNTFWREML